MHSFSSKQNAKTELPTTGWYFLRFMLDRKLERVKNYGRSMKAMGGTIGLSGRTAVVLARALPARAFCFNPAHGRFHHEFLKPVD
jgi:hypothetical protein